jgi:hypothetical protein
MYIAYLEKHSRRTRPVGQHCRSHTIENKIMNELNHQLALKIKGHVFTLFGFVCFYEPLSVLCLLY